MTSELIRTIGRGIRELLKDPTVNLRYPPSRTVAELCDHWDRIARVGEDEVPALRRARAVVLPASEPYQPYTMEDVRRAAKRKLFTTVSLFAGAGGSSTGYGLAGGDVRAALEFNARATHAYRRNNPGTLVVERDIREVLEGDGVERLLHAIDLEPGELDVLDASPPCQQFSTAGPGVVEDPDHETNHGGVKQKRAAYLPLDYAKFVHRARPKVSVMENVVGLTRGRNRSRLKEILQALRFGEAGGRVYYVDWKILTAADYGVGQDRARVIVISIRKDVADRLGIHSDEDVRHVFPRPTHGMVSVRSALEGLEQRSEDEWPFFTSLRASRLPGYLAMLPKCPPKPTRPRTKKYYTLTRCSWEMPTPTLVIAGQKPDGLSGAIHPELERKFTVPEKLRLTSLPDDFVLTGTIEDAVTAICNMVPPLLTKAIAESVYERVLKPYRESGGG
jgi:DNA-cytosine methyltransferase